MKIINGIPPKVGKDEFVAMDVETFGQTKGKLHRPTGTFACLSVAVGGQTVYQVYDSGQIGDVLQAAREGIWVFHNALYDLRQLRRFAKIAPRFVWDTMLVDQSMYGGYYQFFSLKDLVRRWLGERMDKEAQGSFEGATKMTAEMKKYAARDALKTLQVARLQKAEFEDDLAFKAYTMIDEPMIWPILDMPGVNVDAKTWEVTVASFKEEAAKVEEELGFNVKSTQQCHRALNGIGLHLQDTGAKTLAAFKHKPLVASIIKGRLYRDAVSKYGKKWLDENVEEDGLVYSSYHITGAETGRMSSSNPNMQNIPQRVLPIYRTFFTAPEGYVTLVCDVSQQEPRILAHESKDKELLGIFMRGEDSHLAVARVVFNEPTMKKSDPRRDKEGKTINLGLSYGLSEYGLAARLNITEQEAAYLITKYFSRFKDVLLWIGRKRGEAFIRGFIQTVSGRKVYINPHSNGWKNNAINAPIQGGAADFTKMWKRKIWEACRKAKLPYLVDRIVHDEIVLNVPKAQAKDYVKVITDAFNVTAQTLFPDVPFVFDMKKGKSWACKQIKSELYEDIDDE